MSPTLTSQPGVAELPCVGVSLPPVEAPADERPQLSTRKLIIAALVTGLAILVAFAIQVALLAR